jgi:hypothetical protein
MKTIEFTYGGNLCIKTAEGLEREVEIGPHQYRAKFHKDRMGRVHFLEIERDETRAGHPDVWMIDSKLPEAVYDALTEQIEHEDAQEQRRILEMYEGERA